jgi:hypothetical protein
MICYRDMTFCGSPTCIGKCGRKWTGEHLIAANKWWATFNRPDEPPPIAFGYFCDENGETYANGALAGERGA